nr:arylesterase [Methylococcus sp. EFPC2]
MLVLGDSISAGYGLENPEANGWVGLLRARLAAEGKGHEVVNASIPGDTSAGGLTRVGPLLERHRPIVLILELGANDGLRGLQPARLEDNLSAILERARKAGVKPLLLGMRIPPNYGKRYNELFEAAFPDVAQRNGIPWVPFLLDGVGGRADLMQGDGLHPNRTAQPILLENVWQKLKPLL